MLHIIESEVTFSMKEYISIYEIEIMLHMIEIEVTSLRKELYCMAREAWHILGLW